MRAAVTVRFGEPGKAFEIREVPEPEPGKGEILVRVKAASVNPVDVKRRSGKYGGKAGVIQGYDFSGIVEKVGKKADKFKAGDEVYSSGANPDGKGGSYAEFVSVEERLVSNKPRNLSFEEAASIPLVGITAWEALFDKLGLTFTSNTNTGNSTLPTSDVSIRSETPWFTAVKPAGFPVRGGGRGEDILIHGGAGGVGSIAIQLAKWKGASVYTTVSSPEKEKLAKKLGADFAINYRKTDFVEYSRKLNGREGFSNIFDTVGGEVFSRSLKALKPYGKIVSIIGYFDPKLDLGEAMMRNISIHFTMMLLPVREQIACAMEHQGRILEQIKGLVEQGKVRANVAKVFRMEEIGKAHEMAEDGGFSGKIVIRI